MKAVLIAIKPKWVELILRGIKTIEVRKTFPNLIEPFVVYIYVTRGTFDITLCDDLNAASVKLTERARGKVVGGNYYCETNGKMLIPRYMEIGRCMHVPSTYKAREAK